jgi:hypothetical protein
MKSDDMKKVKEMKKNKYKVLGVAVVVFLICAFVVVNKISTGEIKIPENPTTHYDSELERLVKANLEYAKEQTSRPDYLPKEMFSKINAKCPFPQDFYEVREMYKYNWIDEFSTKITECHWKQPEWSADFETRIVPNLLNTPEDRIFVSLESVYPSQAMTEISIDRSDRNKIQYYEFDKKVWVENGLWGVDYFALGLHPVYLQISSIEEKYNVKGQENIVSDPAIAQRYIQIEVNPKEFILEPSFPIYSYEYKKQVMVHIKIDTDIPDGTYIVGFETGLPSEGLDTQCLETYGLPTFSGKTGCKSMYHSSMIFSGRRFIQFIKITSV